jgi:hypothetical protein
MVLDFYFREAWLLVIQSGLSFRHPASVACGAMTTTIFLREEIGVFDIRGIATNGASKSSFFTKLHPSPLIDPNPELGFFLS